MHASRVRLDRSTNHKRAPSDGRERIDLIRQFQKILGFQVEIFHFPQMDDFGEFRVECRIRSQMVRVRANIRGRHFPAKTDRDPALRDINVEFDPLAPA